MEASIISRAREPTGSEVSEKDSASAGWGGIVGDMSVAATMVIARRDSIHDGGFMLLRRLRQAHTDDLNRAWMTGKFTEAVNEQGA
jgi:hypothetical protein